jgi:DNA-binding transcriptional LysR family regulator
VVQLDDLRYFLAVADAGSFTRGARAVHVTPAAVSKAVRRLEDALETQLLVRTTRTVALTADGESLVEVGRGLLAGVRDLRAELERRRGAIAGPLRIAAMEVFSIHLLPVATAALMAEAPAVEPSLFEMLPGRMVELVGRGDLDAGFTIGARPDRRVEVAVLARSPGVLVCGRSHPLHARGRIRPRDLPAHPFVVPLFWGAESAPSLDGFPEQKYSRTTGATIELLMSAVSLVESSQLLGFFPEISVRRELARGTLRKMAGLSGLPSFDLQMIKPRVGLKPGVRRLAEHLRAALR